MAVRSKSVSKTKRLNYNSKGKLSSISYGKRGGTKTKITYRTGRPNKTSLVRPKKR